MKADITRNDDIVRINDMIDALESKISNIVGLLELVNTGAENINGTNDTYELSSINVLKDYLLLINKTDISKVHDMLRQLIETE